MSINRYNYQEFFLLYTDNELQIAERKAVENFVQQNPDLKEELAMLQHSILRPDQEVIFENKDTLLQFDNTENFIHPGNFEEFAIAYADGELNKIEMSRLDEFMLNNPDFRKEFELILSLKLTEDNSITFPGKEQLYRYEKERKPIVLSWWRMAAAAIVLITAGLFWLDNRHDSAVTTQQLAREGKKTPSKNIENPIVSKSLTEKINSKKVLPAPAEGDQDLTSAGKKDNVAVKGGMKPVKKAVKPTVANENNGVKEDAAAGNSVLAANTEMPAIPKSALLNTGSQHSTVDNGQTLATLDASIDRKNRIPDQHSIVVNTINKNDYTAVQTVADTEDDENVSVSGIPLDKKSPLRGLLRKATRFIDKNTASRTSKKSGLLIGNIEIAFQ